MSMGYSVCGSLWRRWDLHFHTPSSHEYDDKSVTENDLVDSLIAHGVSVAAVTDHHRIDVARIRTMQQLAGERLTVLPGIELRDDHGGEPIHYLCIFPENCDLDHVWTTLQGSLGLTPAAIQQKGGDDKIYVPIEKGAKIARSLGGVVSIHAGRKSNSIENISNREQFQQRIKYDITKQWVDLMEVGQLRDICDHLEIIFPHTGLDKPILVCSDNHNIRDYIVKAPLWLRADPTFRGLLMAIREPRDRVFIGTRPPEMIRVEQNPTKYIRRIDFRRRASVTPTQHWFSGGVCFSTGLVAIVGNKGSGKSALADTLGLLGATKNSEFYSFLSEKRFRHPVSGYAADFEATIEWYSDEKWTKGLNDAIRPEEIERLRYLPQDHVETICNELVGQDGEGFEQELKSVIFSHVPETQRLGNSTLDELVRFHTVEKQKRIDSLMKQLRELSRSRAVLESQADPVVKKELEEKIKRRQVELEAHDKLRPEERPDPRAGSGDSAGDASLLRALAAAESGKESLDEKLVEANERLRVAERRYAVAKRLIERLANFQDEFDVFREALAEDAMELGLRAEDLVSFTIEIAEPQRIRDAEVMIIETTQKNLDAEEPPGLHGEIASAEAHIAELTMRLDAPNRVYQAYLQELADWGERRAAIEGTEDLPDSLNGLKAALAALGELPERISQLRKAQAEIARKIHEEKAAQAAVYRTLYGPVQAFIDSHELAKGKLKLEFRAELTEEGFSERLLGLLALNRRGTFMGIDEGRAKAESFIRATRWEDAQSVGVFLESVDTALHVDQRESSKTPVQLRDQLSKGQTPEDVFNLIYGLEYIRPRYILRWEGKDLSMLSPGERGTLLLAFYLLIDKSDMPLVIDQPEGNLDNHTVAKVLVDCIKEARRKRQVFIVTHNPNLAVVCDADQIVHASMDKESGNAITYTCGSLENPAMSNYVTDVLEGTRWAFDVRGAKYRVGEKTEP